MRLEKLTQEDIFDTRHITEVSEMTGEVVTYTKAIYTKDGEEKLENNKRIKLSEKELHQYLRSEVGNFFFYFYGVLDNIDIPLQYKTRLLNIASYIDYNNDDLIVRGECNIKLKLTKSNLKDIMGIGDTEFRKTLKALLDNNLIHKNGKHYKINTSCVIRGDIPKIRPDHCRVFIETIRDLYTGTEPKNHKQLYYIFKLLPHVNRQFNIPCFNVECDTLEDIKPMSLADICTAIGMDVTHRNRLWKMIRGFKIDDDYMMCKHEVDDLDFLCINPKLFYAGTRIENISYMINVFDMAKKVKS